MSERLIGPHADNYYTEGFHGSPEKFDEVRYKVQKVFIDALRPLFVDRHGRENGRLVLARQLPRLKALSSPDTSVVLLREKKSEEIVGLTYATSAHKDGVFEDVDQVFAREIEYAGITLDQFNEVQRETAEVDWTVIREEDRGKGGWGMMMDALEGQLCDRGYRYHTRFVRADNGYAERMMKRYEGKIIYALPLDAPDFMGEQVYFRAKLK